MSTGIETASSRVVRPPDAAPTGFARLRSDAVVAPLVALLLGWTLVAWRHSWSHVFSTRTYDRWDSGWYLDIARHGYWSVTCRPENLPAGASPPASQYLCGSIGWFPGYSAVIRGVSEVTRLSLPVAGLITSWISWYFVLFFTWQLLKGARDRWVKWVCLLLAAFFPGQVYFAAIFPLSLAIAAMLGALFFATQERRPVPAAILGAVAGASYVSGVVLAPALLLTGLVRARGRQRVATVAGGLGAAAGFAAMLVYAQASVGRWNAYFVTKKQFGQGANNPLSTLYERLRGLWDADPNTLARVSGAQTLLVACLVLVVVVLAALGLRNSSRIDLAQAGGEVSGGPLARIPVRDLAVLLTGAGAFLVPLIGGGPATTSSSVRAQAFVVVTVPLLRRLPARLLIVPLAAAGYVAWQMAPYFYKSILT